MSCADLEMFDDRLNGVIRFSQPAMREWATRRFATTPHQPGMSSPTCWLSLAVGARRNLTFGLVSATLLWLFEKASPRSKAGHHPYSPTLVDLMTSSTASYTQLLVHAALACSHHRILQGIYNGSSQRDHTSHIGNAYRKAVDALQKLARVSKACGKDARSSPMYESFGDLSSHYEQTYEQWRPVVCDDLTPRVIFDAMEKGNKLIWRNWTISASRYQEVTDDYGLPAWGRVVTITSPNGVRVKLEHPGRPCYRARKIFESVLGYAFQGNDGLQDDPIHRYDQNECCEY